MGGLYFKVEFLIVSFLTSTKLEQCNRCISDWSINCRRWSNRQSIRCSGTFKSGSAVCFRIKFLGNKSDPGRGVRSDMFLLLVCGLKFNFGRRKELLIAGRNKELFVRRIQKQILPNQCGVGFMEYKKIRCRWSVDER